MISYWTRDRTCYWMWHWPLFVCLLLMSIVLSSPIVFASCMAVPLRLSSWSSCLFWFWSLPEMQQQNRHSNLLLLVSSQKTKITHVSISVCRFKASASASAARSALLFLTYIRDKKKVIYESDRRILYTWYNIFIVITILSTQNLCAHPG